MRRTTRSLLTRVIREFQIRAVVEEEEKEEEEGKSVRRILPCGKRGRGGDGKRGVRISGSCGI